jgi:hypothetical protein
VEISGRVVMIGDEEREAGLMIPCFRWERGGSEGAVVAGDEHDMT